MYKKRIDSEEIIHKITKFDNIILINVSTKDNYYLDMLVIITTTIRGITANLSGTQSPH